MRYNGNRDATSETLRAVSATDLKLLGGAAALDFVNTVDPLVGDDGVDAVASPAALAAWGVHAGLTEVPPAVTGADAERARAVRAVLTRIFVAVAAGGRPAPADLADFAGAYAATLGRATLRPAAGRYIFAAPAGIDVILLPVLESARELLTSDRARRVRQCPADDCGWLFVDTSRNGTRRWCRMSGCGAKAKMRRYRARRAD
jgi:predicted RNA-binding Zn ribbon-like protein